MRPDRPNVALISGAVPLDWQTRVVVLLVQMIQEEQCGFRPGHGTLNSSTPSAGSGSWEFSQPVHMCFVDLEKEFDRVP